MDSYRTIKNEIYFLKHNPVVSNANIDLYLGRGSIEEVM